MRRAAAIGAVALGMGLSMGAATAQGVSSTPPPTYLLPVVDSYARPYFTVGLARYDATGATAEIVGTVQPDRLVRGLGPWISVSNKVVDGITVTESLPRRMTYIKDRVLQVMDLADHGGMPAARALGNGTTVCKVSRVVYVSAVAGQAWLEVSPFNADSTCNEGKHLYIPLNSLSNAAPIEFPATFHLEESLVDGTGKLTGFLGNDGVSLKWLSPDRKVIKAVTGASTAIGLSALGMLPDGRTRLYSRNGMAYRLTVTDTGASLAALNVYAASDAQAVYDLDNLYWLSGQTLYKVGRTGAANALTTFSLMSSPGELTMVPAGLVVRTQAVLNLVNKSTGTPTPLDMNAAGCGFPWDLAWSGKHLYFTCLSQSRLNRATVRASGISIDPTWSQPLEDAWPRGWQYLHAGAIYGGRPLVTGALLLRQTEDIKGYDFAMVGQLTRLDFGTDASLYLGSTYESYGSVTHYDFEYQFAASFTTFLSDPYGRDLPLLRSSFKSNAGVTEERLLRYVKGTPSSLRVVSRSITKW
jgi:hypothetical protein